MLGVDGGLEFPLLLTAYARLPLNSLDPANTHPNTVLRQVVL